MLFTKNFHLKITYIFSLVIHHKKKLVRFLKIIIENVKWVHFIFI